MNTSHHFVTALSGAIILTFAALPSEGRLIQRISTDAGEASASTDGRYLAFTSNADLTGTDSDPPPSCLPPPFEDICDTFESDVFVLDRETDAIELITPATAEGSRPLITADGRYVAFVTTTGPLSYADIYVYDRVTESSEQVNLSTGGVEANGYCDLNAISDDGRYVTFFSYATNLDSGGQTGLFVRDRVAGTTTWLADADVSDLSADGRYVAYRLNAGGCYVLDRMTSVTERVDVSTGGTSGNGFLLNHLSITPDGRYVAFGSDSDNLVAGDTNGLPDVFLRDRLAGTTERVSVGAGGTEANGSSVPPYQPGFVSDDGRYVVFSSSATSGLIGDPDTNGGDDLFLRDRVADTTERITIGWLGDEAVSDETQGIYAVADFCITGATGEVVFTSDSSNLVRYDDNGVRDLFVSNDCSSVPTCGNGAIDDFRCEQCDDGNTTSEDGCSSLCLTETCNDGIVQIGLGEQCDDYNNVDDDGCNATCQIEFCGDNIVQSGIGEECEPALNPVDCDASCLFKREGCPYNLCDCLGEAGDFTVLTSKVKTKGAKFRVFGFPELVGTYVDGNMCVESGKLAGIMDAETQITGDLVFRAGPSDAGGKFKGYKVDGVAQPGTLINGDLVTAGAELKGLDAVQVGGNVDTSGSHPALTPCLAAPAAAANASATLAALTPDQTLGTIKAKEDITLEAGPGITVFDVDDIALGRYKEDGEIFGAYLVIDQDPATVLAVVNVSGSVKVANGAGIFTNGPPEQVVLNLHGDRSTVKVGKGGELGFPVLAPNAKVTVKREGHLYNILSASLSVQGTEVTDALLCSEE